MPKQKPKSAKVPPQRDRAIKGDKTLSVFKAAKGNMNTLAMCKVFSRNSCKAPESISNHNATFLRIVEDDLKSSRTLNAIRHETGDLNDAISSGDQKIGKLAEIGSKSPSAREASQVRVGDFVGVKTKGFKIIEQGDDLLQRSKKTLHQDKITAFRQVIADMVDGKPQAQINELFLKVEQSIDSASKEAEKLKHQKQITLREINTFNQGTDQIISKEIVNLGEPMPTGREPGAHG